MTVFYHRELLYFPHFSLNLLSDLVPSRTTRYPWWRRTARGHHSRLGSLNISDFRCAVFLNYQIKGTHWVIGISFNSLIRMFWTSIHPINKGLNGCLLEHNFMNYSAYRLSQWETMLQCNVVSHWLCPYLERPLYFSKNLAPFNTQWANNILAIVKVVEHG